MQKKFGILFLYIGLLFFFNPPALSQQKPFGIFNNYSAVGTAPHAGSSPFDASAQTYELASAGDNDTKGSEGLHFLWKRISGDFILYARGKFAGKETSPQSKMGLMVSRSLDSNTASVRAVVLGDGTALLQCRKKAGDKDSFIHSPYKHADVIQLERRDSIFIMRIARFGEPFVTEQIINSSLGDDVYVGLFVGANQKNIAEQKAIFQDVRITIPVDENLALLRTDIGSNLEILDVETGHRQLVYTDSNSIHSPIWKKDGGTLIYGKGGYLYTFDLQKRTPQLLYTGEAKNNNNDHVLSFDGTTLAICITMPELGGRAIHTVPVTGGEPKLLTRAAPAYPHSWSPDGKSLLFSWTNKGEYDIYKIPVRGGKEFRLTTAKGRDDCPEFTPDGKHIYFNSARTGTMLLWRMKPDGNRQQPVSDGEYHDWFPHVSPDGKWLLFLSYSKDEVSSAGNPSYRQVYLRLMPVSGGRPRIIAYLYGGQGTINSPCWSPDSKRIAFTSYSDIKQ
jgi:Tol biopolymer transport system component